MFDFEGDGAAEVVYADEHTLWIFDGATGAVKMQQDGHASGTLMEYPLIADVDNDGSTEIIVASNNYTFSGWTGITVIGDADMSWVAARPIWNQYAYHITNVNSDGSIPETQQDNWLTWNNFRAGGTELGPSHWLADLAPEDPKLCLDTCDQEVLDLYLLAGNSGLLDSDGFVIRLEREDGSTLMERLSGPVEAGEGVVLGPFSITMDSWGSGRLSLIVDPEDDVAECDEGNNEVDLGLWPCL